MKVKVKVKLFLSHRQKVKEEIARDRAERASREKTEKQTQNSQASATPPATAVAPKKEYDTCKLQVNFAITSVHLFLSLSLSLDSVIWWEDINQHIQCYRYND